MTAGRMLSRCYVPDATPFKSEVDAARMLAAIVESSDDAIIAKTLDGIILSWNRGAERTYGYAAAEMVGRPITTIIPEELQAQELARIRESIRTRGPVEPFETIRLTKGGQRLHVSVAVSPIRDAAGQVVAVAAIGRNITSRRAAESALKMSEARWRAIVESAVDGIIVMTAQGLIESFNPAAERLFGYAEHEVLGRNVNILMPAPYRDEHDGYLNAYLRTGVKKIIGIGREVVGRRRDNSTFPFGLSVGELQVEGERKFTGIAHDLSERVQVEERLREQASLVKLGEMAAVIAHEVKNPLAAVSGAIQVIGRRLPSGSKDIAIIDEIIARLEALNGLINDLLVFARPRKPQLAPVDVASLLKLTADLLTKDPAFSNLRMEIVGTAPPVSGDAELLKIVFQNLIINAAFAMQGVGVLEASVTAADGTVRITIADSGPGIPPEIREKLFQPFFTTKARGTGLGLATAKRLIEAHFGTIRLDCPARGGTVVTMQLPAHPA